MADTDPKVWAAKTMLDREADARFWAQTHYKVGRRLDPHNPTDRAMTKIWLDIRAKVTAEDRAGKLILTYNDPVVERRLGDARLASQAADAHVSAAIAESDPAVAAEHAAAAAIAAAAVSAAAHDAASAQPPTVSPIVADAAAQEAAASAGLPAPDPAVAQLPPDHPAAGSDAGPVLHPSAAQDPMPPEAPPSPVDRGPDQLDLARAITAPAVAIAVNERAAERQVAGVPPARGALHPRTMNEIRAVAVQLASDSQGDYLGVNYAADDRWSVPRFRSSDEANAWYGHLTDTPNAFRYLAVFDRTSPAFPRPIHELFGSSSAIAGHAPFGGDHPTSKTSYAPVVAAAAVGVVALGALIATKTRKRRHA